MSRQLLGRWGAELDDQSFADALAWSTGAPSIYYVGDDRTVPIDADRSLDRPRLDARDAADAWRGFAASIGGPIRAAIVGRPIRVPVPRFDLGWLVDTLSRASNVGSVIVADPEPRPARPWDWPLDVGFFDDEPSRDLRARLDDQYWAKFVRFVDATRTKGQIDLLLLPEPLNTAYARFGTGPKTGPVHTVLACGGVGRTRDVPSVLRALAAESASSIAGVIDLPENDSAKQWLDATLFHLSHDETLDRAIFAAARNVNILRSPILFGSPDAFAGARTSRAAARIARRVAAARPQARATDVASPRLIQRLHLLPGDSTTDLAKRIEEAPDLLEWHSEGEAATDVVELAHAQQGRGSDGRFVQARLLSDGQPVVDAPLSRGSVYRLDVRVAHPADGWAAALAPFPQDRLPENPDGHELTVVFTAPDVLSEPQRAQLFLPPIADSEPCGFHFRVPENVARLDGRVTLLHGNRMLQTLRVVAAFGGSPHEGPALELKLEAVLRRNLAELSNGPDFDVAWLFNDTAGTPGLTGFGSAGAAYVKLDSVDQLLRSLRGELENITRDPDAYVDPAGEETRTLLVTLARAGAGFIQALGELPGMRPLVAAANAESSRLQIMSIHPDDVVPLELVYDRAFPRETAKPCPAFAGQPCTAACGKSKDLVCLNGFWGIRHVIERRLYDESATRELQARNADYGIACETGEHAATLERVSEVLIGTATRAGSHDAATFDATLAGVRTRLTDAGAGVTDVEAWSDWEAAIAAKHPQLLLLIAHTEERLGAAVLEIGDADVVAAQEIDVTHVRSPPPVPPGVGPVVLLFGCRTALQEVPFSSFVAAFRRANASVVVATLSTVRGRHMAPVAQRAVELLATRGAGARTTVGEAVRDLRRKLLTEGFPIGLTIVSFGEVDWQMGVT